MPAVALFACKKEEKAVIDILAQSDQKWAAIFFIRVLFSGHFGATFCLLLVWLVMF
jgi:hypothetical protein